MESNLTICRQCGERKLRIVAGKFPSKNKKYTDETGKLWNGKLCPICNDKRVKDAMKAFREKCEYPR